MKTWKEKRDYLVGLIKNVSHKNGGDDPEWLKDYAKEMIKKYAEDLDVCIACFELLNRTEAICVVSALSGQEFMAPRMVSSLS